MAKLSSYMVSADIKIQKIVNSLYLIYGFYKLFTSILPRLTISQKKDLVPKDQVFLVYFSPFT